MRATDIWPQSISGRISKERRMNGSLGEGNERRACGGSFLGAAALGKPRSDIVTPIFNPILGFAITRFRGCERPRVSAAAHWEPSNDSVSSSRSEEPAVDPVRLGDVDASSAHCFAKSAFVFACLLYSIQ
jgi:hypothetical protein